MQNALFHRFKAEFYEIPLVCNDRLEKVFKGLAARGKTTAGFFYGFKLHLIVNEKEEILAFLLTPGNVANVSMLDELSLSIFGKIFGDKGCISAEISI